MKKARKLEEEKEIEKVFEIRKKNHPLTSLLKNKIGNQRLENYPQEVDYYLLSDKDKKNNLEAEKDKIEKEIGSFSEKKLAEKLQRKNNLEVRIKELDKEQKRNFIPK